MSSPEDAWPVHRLARTLKARIENDFPPIWVQGEITGVKRYPSGHIYFCLKDELSKVDCTMWRTAAVRLRSPLTEGTSVFVLGTPAVWEERTQLRFNVAQVLATSEIGATAQAIERIKQALLRDGLLDPARKRALPAFASRIAVITSTAGAAVRDIITVADRRWPGVELLVINAAVQGENAAREMIAALSVVERLERIDCCIIGRGGGAREDLAAFNDEALCRAIAACSVPVVSAVGHEVDVTLADLVADVRAATPSQAAEFVLPDRRDVVRRVEALGSSLLGAMSSLTNLRRERMQRTSDRMANALLSRLRGVERRLGSLGARLDPGLRRHVVQPRERLQKIERRMVPAMQRRTGKHRETMARLGGQLDALSPLAVMGRGFAMALDEQGRILKRAVEFTPGKRFTLRVSDGVIPASVEEQ
jgi:exodeoxyribonuclease VII large subunit